MKKTMLLHSEISYLIAQMGHKDSLAIGDAGLPVPKDVQKIDVAISKDVPSFLEVFSAVLSEQEIEKVIMAQEIQDKNGALHEKIMDFLKEIERNSHKKIQVEYIAHEEFKKETSNCKAVIRTGECTSFGNIILVSGVVF